MEWGRKKIGEWTQAYHKHRKDELSTQVDEDLAKSDSYNSISPSEVDSLKTLLREIYPSISDQEGKHKQACRIMADAWVRKPMRETVKQLWDGLGGSNMSAGEIQSYLNSVDQLKKSHAPELLDLGVTAAMRLHAVQQMRKLVHKGATETHLQRLIEDFPWLLKPNWECLTANQEIKTILTMVSPNEELEKKSEYQRRPDFVFLSDAEDKHIVIIELKGAEHYKNLQFNEYRQ